MHPSEARPRHLGPLADRHHVGTKQRAVVPGAGRARFDAPTALRRDFHVRPGQTRSIPDPRFPLRAVLRRRRRLREALAVRFGAPSQHFAKSFDHPPRPGARRSDLRARLPPRIVSPLPLHPLCRRCTASRASMASHSTSPSSPSTFVPGVALRDATTRMNWRS
eukprot:scaffold1060_cov385-Pavlova_lutheri.AAC.25